VLAAPTIQIQRFTCYSLNRMAKLAANALTTIAIILVKKTRIMAIVVQITPISYDYTVHI
jgi:hypothetical protein